MKKVTKVFPDLPAAHRQPKHGGHCRLIHGHNWGFEITFVCDILDPCGFVIDVGTLRPVRELLQGLFDHTLLLNNTDPIVTDSSQAAVLAVLQDLSKVVVVPDCGMEGLAEHVFHAVNNLILEEKLGPGAVLRGLKVIRVVCHEDSKNSAVYEP